MRFWILALVGVATVSLLAALLPWTAHPKPRIVHATEPDRPPRLAHPWIAKRADESTIQHELAMERKELTDRLRLLREQYMPDAPEVTQTQADLRDLDHRIVLASHQIDSWPHGPASFRLIR